jgi:hypothetical protein
MKHIKHINEGGYDYEEELPKFQIDDHNERPTSEVLFQLVYGSYLEEYDTDLLYNEDRFENTIFMKEDDGSLWLMSISDGSAQAIDELKLLGKSGLGPYVSDSNAEDLGASSGEVIAIWDLENLATDMFKDGEWTDNFEDFEFGLGSGGDKYWGIGFLKITEEDVVDDLIDTVRKSQMKSNPKVGTGFEGWAHMRDKKRQDNYSMARFRGHGFAYRTAIKILHDYGQVLKKQSDKSDKD